MTRIDWQKDLKDTMWAMFWMRQENDAANTEADKAVLKENVARLIRLATQKNAGQRRAKDCLDWDSIDTTIMGIVCAATSLCLSGALGEMPETIDGDPV